MGDAANGRVGEKEPGLESVEYREAVKHHSPGLSALGRLIRKRCPEGTSQPRGRGVQFREGAKLQHSAPQNSRTSTKRLRSGTRCWPKDQINLNRGALNSRLPLFLLRPTFPGTTADSRAIY